MTAVQDQLDEERARAGANGMTQDEFLAWVRENIAANAVVAQARAARSRVRKQAKAAGMELAKMDAAILMADWSPTEVREHFRVELAYARWMQLPIGEQLNMFDGMDEDEISELDAESMGFIAATTGKGVFGVPPDSLAPELHQSWLKGHSRGTQFNAPSPLKPDPEPDAPPLVAEDQTDIEDFGPTDDEVSFVEDDEPEYAGADAD